jgi:RNA polymerase sigma factor (sigma-70 family)
MDGEYGFFGGATADLGGYDLGGGVDGARSLERLLEDHRDLVLSTVMRFARPGHDLGALVQAGAEGLLDAAARFDASCGSFAGFAAFWVRRRVMRASRAL